MPYFHCDPYLIIPHSFQTIQWMTLITFLLSLRPNNVQDTPLSSQLFLVDCLLIDIYTLNLLNTIDRYYHKEKIINFDIYIPTQSCVNLMVILFKRICVNILTSPFLIQFIHVGYRLF